MRRTIALLALATCTACGERMDMQMPTAAAATRAPVDIAAGIATARAPLAADPAAVPTRNARICTAAMARVAAGASVAVDGVDGNTAQVRIGGERRECLVDADRVVWRRADGVGGWHDDGLVWRERDGRIAIGAAA